MAEDAVARMEEALAKKGIELFREVCRLMDDAEVEDYHKNGVWRDDLMRLDLQLIDAHRKEGGAPDPPDLEEVPTAETLMPKPALASLDPAKLALLAQLRGGAGKLPAGALPGGLQGMLAARIAALRDAARAGGAPAAGSGAGAPAGGTGPAAELRLVALFVAKWKLDPTRTKAVLAELTAPRRRHVIQKFKTDSTGVEATEHLETFIAECDLTNSWAAAPASSPVGGAAAQLAAALARNSLGGQGVKRPLPLGSPSAPGASPALSDAAKRARLSILARGMSGGAGAGAAQAASMQQRLAAAQAASAAVRGGLAGALAARQGTLGAQARSLSLPARPGAAGGANPMAVALALRRQQLAAAASRPAGGGQAGAKPPGDLIRNLLQRF